MMSNRLFLGISIMSLVFAGLPSGGAAGAGEGPQSAGAKVSVLLATDAELGRVGFLLRQDARSDVLRRLHVGLVEGVDAENVSRYRRRELPAEELAAELERIAIR